MQNENPSLGRIIVGSRKKLGLSQEALAEKANVSLSTIQRIEKGTVKPRSFTIKVLAETLGLDVSALLSDLVEKETSRISFYALKRMNLYSMLCVFIPFITLVIPIIVWKIHKEIDPRDTTAGKIVSFQLLWSSATIIGMGITLFLSNLIIGKAGNGLFISIIFYLLAVLFNIFVILKTASKLNNEDENVLSFVPNLF